MMKVYFSGRLIVVETNVQWALPYWTKRKVMDKRIGWKMIRGKE
jgi:hypothetical protein